MFEFVTKDNLSEFEAFVSAHPKGHFIQSHLWAAQKPEWKWEAVIVRKNNEITGACSFLIRRLPSLPYTLMYAGRGPVCDVHDAETLSAITEGAKALAKRYNAYCLKIDPDVLSSDTEFTSKMLSLGYTLRDPGKNFSGIQPRYVFRLYLNGRSEEELFASFHSKTRYNIRVAERKGVTVKIVGKEECATFSRLMTETGVRDGFVVRNQKYFEDILENLGDSARLYMAYTEEGVAIAGTLAIHYGDKVWYLYGASSNAHRNLMPNYLLQWNMIQWAVEVGARVYDFRGVSGDLSEDNPLYGLYRFKKGFNGDFTEFVGEFEYRFKPLLNAAITHGERIYRKLRARIFLRRHSEG